MLELYIYIYYDILLLLYICDDDEDDDDNTTWHKRGQVVGYYSKRLLEAECTTFRRPKNPMRTTLSENHYIPYYIYRGEECLQLVDIYVKKLPKKMIYLH